MFSRSDLEEFVKFEGQPAISIYLPTHLAGREVLQDTIRLKNLLPQQPSASWPAVGCRRLTRYCHLLKDLSKTERFGGAASTSSKGWQFF